MGNKDKKNCGVFPENIIVEIPLSHGHMYRQPFFTHVSYTYEHAHTGDGNNVLRNAGLSHLKAVVIGLYLSWTTECLLGMPLHW